MNTDQPCQVRKNTISQLFANPVRLLAPMEGLTDPLMRQILTQIASDLGRPYDWSVSEFIRITQHVLPAHVFYKYVPELHHDAKTSSGTPIHVQLLGSEAQLMAENAAYAAELGAPAIDINFGCPAKTVNSHRGGSVLLDEPEVMYDIISAVRGAVPDHLPVSAKIRLGYTDTSRMDDIRGAIASSGADWLTIHARTKTQGYKPPAYWDKIQNFNTLSIPVIANGEIWNVEQAQNCMEQAATKHLMLGRGAVTRPDLVAQVDNNAENLDNTATLLWQDLIAHQIKFLEGAAKSDVVLVGRYKQWLGMLTKGFSEAQTLWEEIKREKNKTVIINALQASVR
ncbi:MULTISPECIES: tRNA dihydrouridine synthase [Psychrobacter]|uniref:tRNA-dihydrouridine(16) synthase n=1 Tax=Psychrobacter alimentarius TaxID=261164 RepID=A0ABM6A184_9GAMM|nr:MULTISPECIES: tRNA-dihydrouridine synthase [Psychrobacter]AMT98126.1 tRNA-dihydrouridine synthase [Psychrobacter alimentarius]QCB29608.1 tRNA dihydrouridine(16) synthase DusC [Psychrobacter sp. PAMC27889]